MKPDKIKFNTRIQRMLSESLLNTDELKASTILDFNIQPEKILPHIIDVQRLKLEPLIGTKLMRKLQDTPLTFEYDMLKKDFVEPYLVASAMSAYTKLGVYEFKQGGLYRHLPTDAEPVEHYEVSLVSKQYQYRADEYAKRMITFIKKYPEYYPEYKECIGDGISARRGKRAIIGGWNLQNTASPKDRDSVSSDLWASNNGCCGESVSPCSGSDCPPDTDIFNLMFFWGNSDEVDMGFDLSTLSDALNTKPNTVQAQPVNDYFWIVGGIDFNIGQAGVQIPYVDFTDSNANSEIFVKGTQDGYTWFRVKVNQVYESPVTFNIL